jgi:hypothetical protein
LLIPATYRCGAEERVERVPHGSVFRRVSLVSTLSGKTRRTLYENAPDSTTEEITFAGAPAYLIELGNDPEIRAGFVSPGIEAVALHASVSHWAVIEQVGEDFLKVFAKLR